jgi:hypothetical protein
MLIRALLVVVLVMAVLFAWRAWRAYPGMAVLAGAAAAVFGVLLLKNPFLAAIGLLAAGVLIATLSRPKR